MKFFNLVFGVLLLCISFFIFAHSPVSAETCYNAFGDPYECGTDPGDGTTNVNNQPSRSTCYNAFGDPYECGTDPGDGTTNNGGNRQPQSSANSNVRLFDPIDKSIEEIFRAILDIIIVFAVPIVLFFIVWAGFLYVTARGDTAQLEKAHKALLYAVIGGVIVLGAEALLLVITNTINIFSN